jgi:NADPH:quinone reductase
MKAIVISQPGGPEVLVPQDVPTPAPGRGEVRVRVHATAVNRADLLQRMGRYAAPAGVPANIPGLEHAGEVDALGEGATAWKVGDRVFGLVGGGAYAEHVVVHERELARIPDGVSWRDAASIPEAAVTAWDAMVTQAGLTAGENVLITAAGSGVGTAAIQIAAALGAQAIGTSRTADKLERARPLGLVHGVVPDDKGSFSAGVLAATGRRGADVILELVGGGYLAEDIACAAPRGRIVLVGLMAGVRTEIDLAAVLQKRLVLRGTVLRSRPLEEKIAAAQVLARHLVPLVARGAIRPVVDRVFPLSAAAEAHTYVASNAGFGKVILEP